MAGATVGGMYQPLAFREERDDVVRGLVRTAGFGHLVVACDGALTSTPMPFVVDDELSTVRAHLARPNGVWRAAPCDVLLIVPVSDAYVSPGWYPSKVDDGRVVPTWNYEVVHLHGRLLAHDDADWVYRQITDLTDTNEASMTDRWAVTDAPDDHVAKLLRGIVGIELVVERIEAKRKLSQNRSDRDRAGVRRGLLDRDDRSRAIASSMEDEEHH